MTQSFKCWLFSREPACREPLSSVHEVSSHFDRRRFNDLFDGEVRRLTQSHSGHDTRLFPSVCIDWVGYIARSLRNAGFRDHDIDALTQEIVVKLLVSPGGLFKNWDGQPIEGRFKVAVRNAVLNLVEKRRNWQRFPTISIGKEVGMASPEEIATRQQSSGHAMIEAFRQFLRLHHGEVVLQVFDHRFGGGDVKKLVSAGLSSYAIKEAVKRIKAAGREFAADDPELAAMIDRAFRSEAETMARRFSAKTA
jgi:hypothetical protein